MGMSLPILGRLAVRSGAKEQSQHSAYFPECMISSGWKKNANLRPLVKSPHPLGVKLDFDVGVRARGAPNTRSQGSASVIRLSQNGGQVHPFPANLLVVFSCVASYKTPARDLSLIRFLPFRRNGACGQPNPGGGRF